MLYVGSLLASFSSSFSSPASCRSCVASFLLPSIHAAFAGTGAEAGAAGGWPSSLSRCSCGRAAEDEDEDGEEAIHVASEEERRQGAARTAAIPICWALLGGGWWVCAREGLVGCSLWSAAAVAVSAAAVATVSVVAASGFFL